MKTISIPTNDRPHYFRQCLDSLSKAIGIEDWTLVFSCEPHAETFDLVKHVAFAPTFVSQNAAKRGCWDNTFLACETAMSIGSTFNLYFEDDCILSRDALVLCDQFASNPVSTSPSMLALRMPEVSKDNSRPSEVTAYHTGLLGDGFAFHSKDWPLLREVWFNPAPMWDIAVERGTWKRLQHWRPFFCRSQNIGRIGTHTHKGALEDFNRSSPCYDGEPVQSFTFL